MNWEAISVIVSIIAALQAIAAAYLRLFVKNELNQLHQELTEAINKQFISREIFETKISALEQRLARVESVRA